MNKFFLIILIIVNFYQSQNKSQGQTNLCLFSNDTIFRFSDDLDVKVKIFYCNDTMKNFKKIKTEDSIWSSVKNVYITFNNKVKKNLIKINTNLFVLCDGTEMCQSYYEQDNKIYHRNDGNYYLYITNKSGKFVLKVKTENRAKFLKEFENLLYLEKRT